MTKTARRAAGVAVVVAVLGWTSSAAAESAAAVAGQLSLLAPDAHVRGLSPRVRATITEAATQSKTFRGLVDWINASDGIVYVEEGTCGHGVRACFVTVTTAGPNRILRVKVDTRQADSDLLWLIGHELRHTIEVLSNPTVMSQVDMYFFYGQAGQVQNGGRAFETTAAIEAGLAVRAELRASAAAQRRK